MSLRKAPRQATLPWTRRYARFTNTVFQSIHLWIGGYVMTKEIIHSNQNFAGDTSMARRQILKSMCALSAVVAGATLNSCNWADAQDSDHPAHVGREGHATTGPTKYQDLLDAALLCVNRGEACINLCAKQLGAGDTSMKDCMNSVSTMLPMCTAVARFAAFDAPRLKEVVKLCIDVCSDCEKECHNHEQHHVQCKNCADSCAAFIREGRKVIGA
jgi:Cys-rich four helix bundle protein (predicted Tat secretion target)